MGYRCYFKGQTADNKIKDELCLGKLYGYNEDNDGFMLGYTYIMMTPEYKDYKSEDDMYYSNNQYNDYEIIDMCFTARGSIDMHLTKTQFLLFLALYLFDYQTVWGEYYPIESMKAIKEYLKDCVSVFVEWI